MTIITDLFQSASNGILSIFEYPIPFVVFSFFLLWASYNDIKTMTVRNYQNLSFFIGGVLFLVLSSFGITQAGFTLGMGHLYGAIVGFLLLFIPGMILNYAFGGDIKFVTVMGFWIGPTAILLILLVATLIQLLILVGRSVITKNFGIKNNFPFAPAFSIAYFVSLAAFLIF